MNAKTIEGLKMIEEGLKTVINSLEGEKISSAETKATEKKTSPVVTPDEAPVSESVPVTGNLTREQLDGMSYNNLKKLCKDLGIPAVGNRDEITDKILGVEVEVSEEADEEAPAPKAKTSKRGKTATPEEVEVDEEDNDPVYAQIVEAVADMETEEIADLLAEVGVSAKGKREALIEKLVQAVKDGLIDFSDEEDEEAEVDETADVPAPSTAKEEADEEEEEDDGVNDIENPDMTEERKNAILAQDKSIRKKFSQGKVKREELEDFLKKFYDTDEDLSDMSDEDILDTYIDAVCRLIDDDGDLIDEGAYSLNGEYACCGRHLSYVEETGVYICESCGEEYEIEEE